VIIAAIVAIAVIAARAPNGLPFVGYHRLNASLRDAGNLQPHNEVEIAGVRVGQVVSIKAEGSRAIVQLQLDPSVGRLPADTVVNVRGQGLLGARYVELVPGRSGQTLPEGATLQGSPTALAYGVPDALDTFDAQTRGALGSMLRGLGDGFLGNGTRLNGALAVAAGDGLKAQAISGAVLAPPGAAQQLIPSLDGATAALDNARQDIAGLLAPTAKALEPFVDQRSAVQQALDRAPAALAAAQPALERSRQLLASVRQLAQAASTTLPQAPAGLRETTALLQDSPVPLQSADALLATARTAVPAALRITHSVQPLLSPLQRALTNSDPLVTELSTYGCDLGNFGKNWQSALGWGVPGTPYGSLDNFRVVAIAGPDSIQGLGSVGGPGIASKVVNYSPPCVGIGNVYRQGLALP
jgi:virulence factor Mce-like protein